jgi:transposase InsO family protein
MEECTAEADEPETEAESLQTDPTSDSEESSGPHASAPIASEIESKTVSNDQNQVALQPTEQTGKLQKVLAEMRVATLPVPEQVQQKLVEVVKSNLDAFAASPTDLGRTSVVRHTIQTGEAQPFRHKLRAIPFARRQYLEQEVEKLLAIGAISEADPGACPYASRTVIAPKKDGTFRMCVDYRDVNAQTQKDAFPLPRIDQIWQTLSNARYFASLDLLMGYHQVEVEPKDRFKTAFLTHRGLYIYNVMPFGLCNAPATFQRLMERIFGTLIGRGILVYLDDVLIYAETPEQLLEILDKVLKLLARAGLKCKGSKCSLFTEKVHYLGHVVSKNGIKPEPTKLDKIRLWPKPEKGTGLASFLGLCNYYRDLIPSFAHISDPLYKVSRSEYIEWTSALEASFDNLKEQLCQPRIVRMPDPQRDFILETDGSRIAVGAVLKQKFEDTGLEHPVGFFSRALSGSERNYVAYELEMYAVVRAVEHFRMFLLGKEFLLRTDHTALRNLLRRDLPPTTRVERWILRLSEYTFRIEYQRGQDNVIADVLSRLPFASAHEVDQKRISDSTSAAVPEVQHGTSAGKTTAHLDNSVCNNRKQTESRSQSQGNSEKTTSNGLGATAGIGVPQPIASATLPQLIASANVHLSCPLPELDEGEQSEVDDSDCSEQLESESGSECEDDYFKWNEEEHVSGAESCNYFSTSAPLVDLPISREGLTADDFTIPTREQFATEQKGDIELKQLREWIEIKQCPSADELAGLSARMKTFVQLFNEISVIEEVLVIKRHDDPERALTVVPSSQVDLIIRFYHEGPGGAHQAPKATSAKIIRCFWWPDLKRDVRLYVACCPVCERFLQINRTPRAGLRSMAVGGRGDCLAMDIVGGKDSFPLTPRGNLYILTMIDCFSRYGIAVPLPDQSAEVVISAVLGHYITLYGTPRRILTDQGRNFESEQFLNFCHLFRIHKIRTTAYHPQSNGICERFNQTLKHSLAKSLSKPQQPSWDLYLNFAVFSYNLSVHSSTGFTPFFLTFGCEARLPPDIVFGSPTSNSADGSSYLSTSGPLSLLFKSFSLLSGAFESVRQHLKSFHQREKDHYDLGAIERIFQPGDRVRVRLKSRQKGHAKFLSTWSEPHEVLSVRGVVVTLRELATGREYVTHHDRLSNPLFSRGRDLPEAKKPGLPQVPAHEANANPQENLQEPEPDSMPVGNPEEALIRTRVGRVVKSRRDPEFDYSMCLPESSNTSEFNHSSISTSSLARSHMSSSQSNLSQSLSAASSLLPPHANTESLSLKQASRIRQEQNQRVERMGQKVCWIEDIDGTEKQAFMYKANGTVFVFDLDIGDWISLVDGKSLTDVCNHDPYPRTFGSLPLTDEQVDLPASFKEFPGYDGGHLFLPRYGFKKAWLDFVATRAQAQEQVSELYLGLIGAIQGGSSPATSLKATSGAAWTAAQRAQTEILAAPLSVVQPASVSCVMSAPTSVATQPERRSSAQPSVLSLQGPVLASGAASTTQTPPVQSAVQGGVSLLRPFSIVSSTSAISTSAMLAVTTSFPTPATFAQGTAGERAVPSRLTSVSTGQHTGASTTSLLFQSMDTTSRPSI